MKHFNLTIKGQVHKVGFRFMALQMAYEYGVRGFVQNKKDAVYIEIEGDEESTSKFIKWAKKGPLGAIVESSNVEEDKMKDFKAFDILHNQ